MGSPGPRRTPPRHLARHRPILRGKEMSERGQAEFVELLGVARAKKTDDPSDEQQVAIILSVSTSPARDGSIFG